MPTKLVANKRVTKKIRAQADALPAPSGPALTDDLPFTVAQVVPLALQINETFTAPSGHQITDPTMKLECTSVQIKLPVRIMTKDKTFGYEDRTYVVRLPFRTDSNALIRDGHTSADIVRALLVDPNYRISFDLIELHKEDVKHLHSLARDKDFRKEIAARRDVLEKQPVLAMNAQAMGIAVNAPPTVAIPVEEY